VIEDQISKKLTQISTNGVFVAIGMKPNTNFLKGFLKVDSYGYLIVSDQTRTSVNGVFAAGEVADFRYRQAITSAASGSMAAFDCQAYLAQKKINFKKEQ
jgi:thioredoxin reductase (NADPH)